MLSILIPAYNYNIVPLVAKLNYQLVEENIAYEIVIVDDCSSDRDIFEVNRLSVSSYDSTYLIPLAKNIGRGAVRNLLIDKATYENLLFLDADVAPKYDTFIKKYVLLLQTNYQIVCGGIVYQEDRPRKEELLRWVYGNAREDVSIEERIEKPFDNFLGANFLIKKKIAGKIKFDENVPYCEDTLFSLSAMQNGLTIRHVNNVVIHLGLETSKVFLEKSLESLEIRQKLIKDSCLDVNYTRITWLASRINKFHLGAVFSIFYVITKDFFEKKILSDNPSMLCFDLYRLGYYFYYERRNTK